MKEYQSDDNIVAFVNDFERTADIHIGGAAASSLAATAGRAVFVENLNFAFLADSRHSPRHTSSLSLSQSNFDYWPEFQQNYNSIMDNTNLLDSCAAALSDITCDDDDSSGDSSSIAAASRRELNRAILFDRNHIVNNCSSPSSNVSLKSISPIDVERFSLWLCEMEMRVADQPTLSQIFAMTTDEMAAQLNVHSKLFNDIVAQPCIVNGSTRNDHKLLEERYHLLYLKAYEVQLLLEGLPGDNINVRTSANKILNKSFYDFGEFNNVTEQENEAEPDAIAATNDTLSSTKMENSGKRDDNEDQISDKNNSRMFTRTNKRATNFGTYYFKYEQTMASDDQQSQHRLPTTLNESARDSDNNNSTAGNCLLLPIDTEISFTSLYDNEIRSYLNESDTVYGLDSNGFIVGSTDNSLASTVQLAHFGDETLRVSQNTRLWNDLDFTCAAKHRTSVMQQFASDTESHSKVRNWLNSRTDSVKFMSSLSLDRISSDDDCRVLYRSRSELNLGARQQRPLKSFHSSSNGSATFDFKESDNSSSVVDDGSLVWDAYQHVYGSQHHMDDENIFDADEMYTMTNKLCDFGNDYSLYMHSSSSISLNDVGEIGAVQHSELICEEKITGDSVTTVELPIDEEEIKRQRRLRIKRKKRAKKRQQKKHSKSDVSSDMASTTNTSTTSLDSSHPIESFEQQSNIKETQMPSVPSKTIKYDSSANKFEVYSDELGETKQLKVSELRPEDFHDVIKMCQTNIDCLITVLGAKPNQVLTVAYCRRMKSERNGNASSSMCQCAIATKSIKSKQKKKSSASVKECQCNVVNSTCICLWVEQTIAMILNFLMDCWNIFRNMKLYTYLCRVLKSLFGSTRYVADHLKMRSELTKLSAVQYL